MPCLSIYLAWYFAHMFASRSPILFEELPKVFQNHLAVHGPNDYFTLAVNLLILIFLDGSLSASVA